MMFRILILLRVPIVMSLTPIRQYLISADFLSGFKAREYSIYDQTGQHLQYRIESRYHVLQTIELIAYPRKNVTGKLQARINPFEYEADFEVYDG
ncbi:unnamed protein product, partial [Rotaria sp. Silwood2]